MKSLYPKSVVVLASILSMNGCGKNLHVKVPGPLNQTQPAFANNMQMAPQGFRNQNGAPGSKIIFGTANPTPVQGALTDVFMNTVSGDVFSLEPSGWVLKGNFKGPKGDEGKKGLDGVPGTEAGNKILSGPIDPTAETGMPGDLFINQTSTELFQKSADGKWAPLFKMKGDRGEKGEAGPGTFYGSGVPTGNVTPVGGSYLDVGTGTYYKRSPDGSYERVFQIPTSGTPGKDGTQILDGVGSPDPKSGVAGDYYFEDLTGDLYRKDTDGQWKLRMSLHNGNTRAPAPMVGSAPRSTQTGNVSGVPFAAGEGVEGANASPVGGMYLDKETGNLYTKNPDGQSELVMNLKGDKGSTIFNGQGDPEKTLGAPADYYLDTDSMELYSKDANSTWIGIGSIKGDMGPQGPQGIPGLPGASSMTVRNIPAPRVDLPLSLENAELGFEFGKSAIDQNSTQKLARTAQLLQKFSGKIAEIRVVGYADKSGAESANLNLSRNRAKAVAIVLGKSGVGLPIVLRDRGEGEVKISGCAAANSGNQTKGDHLKCAKDRRVDMNLTFNSSVTVSEKNAVIAEIKQDFNGIWNK